MTITENRGKCLVPRLVRLLLVVLALVPAADAAAQEQAHAKQILSRTIALFKSTDGVSLHFDVRAVRVFHRSGDFKMWRNFTCTDSPKQTVWSDGTTTWTLEKRRKTIRIKESETRGRGKIDPLDLEANDYRYELKSVGANYQIRIQATKRKSSIKEAYVVVNKKTCVPVQLRLKYGLIWGTMDITKFSNAHLSKVAVAFSAASHRDCKIIDNR